MIRFTVVTITYNAEAVLARTLQSVMRQTYEGVEHLIIDGRLAHDGFGYAGEDAGLGLFKPFVEVFFLFFFTG